MKTIRNILILLGLFILAAYRLRRWIFARLLRIAPPRHKVRVQRGLRISMADGVTLALDLYEPGGLASGPAVLIRVPYGRGPTESAFGHLMDFCARRFAERGYYVVLQDVRGRFGSGGDFDPYFNEKEDGLATLQWMRQQPWYNGMVGMWGGSYLGIVQWVLADQASDLKALVPSISSSQLRMIVYPDDVLDLGLALRWAGILQELEKHHGQPLLASADIFPRVERAAQRGMLHLPLAEADEAALGRRVAFYRKWLENEDPQSELWQEQERLLSGEIGAPMHLLGGWYDFFLRAMLHDYHILQRRGLRPYLTIGPWHHFSQIMSLADIQEGLAWLDAHLRGERSSLREKPVRVYMMGADEWHEMEDWPPPSQPTHYYLAPGRELRPQPPAADAGYDSYRYDPADPTPALGGAIFSPLAGPKNNRSLESRPDVLVYTGAVLERPLEIMGAVRLELYVQSSQPSADFFGRLCDVHPDGRSINICDGLFRVSGADRDVVCITVDMWATAYRFRPGHRLRLLVASGAHPRWNRNPGTGEPAISAMVLQAADQRIYSEQQHASALILPVVAGSLPTATHRR